MDTLGSFPTAASSLCSCSRGVSSINMLHMPNSYHSYTKPQVNNMLKPAHYVIRALQHSDQGPNNNIVNDGALLTDQLAGLDSRKDSVMISTRPAGFNTFDYSNNQYGSAASSNSSSATSSQYEDQSSASANDAQVLVATADMGSSTSADIHEQAAIDRAINGMIVAAGCAFAITKILTVDHDYWHGWTVFEIVRYAPLHNWSAYEEALKSNPVLAKMMISGVVYSIGDWIAQCYEGKPVLEINRERILRSGLVGFSLHGSLSHFYYHIFEFIFPFNDWWAVPIKVAFDQTIWSGIWNSIYFVTLGLLRFESPKSIASELKATFWPMLTAGWKLWPFAHLVTYGVIPLEQRLLWVDCVELVWVTILSMYSNEKAEARIVEGSQDASSPSTSMTIEE